MTYRTLYRLISSSLCRGQPRPAPRLDRNLVGVLMLHTVIERKYRCPEPKNAPVRFLLHRPLAAAHHANHGTFLGRLIGFLLLTVCMTFCWTLLLVCRWCAGVAADIKDPVYFKINVAVLMCIFGKTQAISKSMCASLVKSQHCSQDYRMNATG